MDLDGLKLLYGTTFRGGERSIPSTMDVSLPRAISSKSSSFLPRYRFYIFSSRWNGRIYRISSSRRDVSTDSPLFRVFFKIPCTPSQAAVDSQVTHFCITTRFDSLVETRSIEDPLILWIYISCLTFHTHMYGIKRKLRNCHGKRRPFFSISSLWISRLRIAVQQVSLT